MSEKTENTQAKMEDFWQRETGGWSHCEICGKRTVKVLTLGYGAITVPLCRQCYRLVEPRIFGLDAGEDYLQAESDAQARGWSTLKSGNWEPTAKAILAAYHAKQRLYLAIVGLIDSLRAEANVAKESTA